MIVTRTDSRGQSPTQLNTRSFAVATYAVLTCRDALDSYFIMSPSWAVSEALNEGWVLLIGDLTWQEASELRARLYNEDVSIMEVVGEVSL